jgi:hypothetical protein
MALLIGFDRWRNTSFQLKIGNKLGGRGQLGAGVIHDPPPDPRAAGPPGRELRVACTAAAAHQAALLRCFLVVIRH